MRKAEPNDVEIRVVRMLAGELVRLGVAVDPTRVARAVHDVLADPTLAAEEEKRLLAGGSADPIADVLALRVERAMRAGLEAADPTVTYSAGKPAVLFLREGGDIATLTETLTSTLAARSKETVAGTEELGPLLVLAQPSAFETLRHDAGTLDLDFSAATKGTEEGGKNGPSVVQVGEAFLAEVHRKAREFVQEHGLDVDPLIGKTFANQYELERCIGRGGFGSVYVARDLLLGNRVAIKILTPRSAVTEEQKQDFTAQLEEFRQEARRLVRLSHDNIVDWKVFAQTEDGTYYFVMELLEGEELDDLLKREGRLEPKRVANILFQVLGALRAAHHLNPTDPKEAILHLDLKPKNVFYLKKRRADEPDRVKVIDFGIGQYIGGSEREGDRSEVRAIVSDSTQGGASGAGSTADMQPMGTVRSIVHRSTACTPEYASPEQCTHMLSEAELAELGVSFTRLDGRSDIYSLGVMGFQLLTGQLPFERPGDRRAFLRKHIAEPPRKVGSMGITIPRKLARFVDRCLAKDPEARFADTNGAYAALEQVVYPFKWRALAGVAAVALAVTTGAIWWAMSRQQSRRFDLLDAPNSIYCGVDHPTHRISTHGVPEDLIRQQARLVGNTNRPESNVLDWSVDWIDEELEIRAPPNVDAGQDRDDLGFLEIRSSEGDAWYSGSIRLRYLGTGSVVLDAVGVPGLGDKRLDPQGQELDIRIAARSEDIKKVAVRGPWEGERLPVVSPISTETDQRYGLDLGELDLPEGEVTLDVFVTDMADRLLKESAKFWIVAEDLDFSDEPSLTGVSLYSSGSYSIGSQSNPQLAFRLNRDADVTWVVKRLNGTAIEGGRDIKNVRSGPFPVEVSDEQDYSGWIEVTADDSRYVLHALAGKESAQARLYFDFSTKEPEFEVERLNSNGTVASQLFSGQPIFLRESPRIQISQRNPLPVVVEIISKRTNEVLETRPLTDPTTRNFVCALDFESDGEHSIEVRGFRFDAISNEKQGEGFPFGPFSFVVDTTSPVLRVDFPDALVLTEKNWSPPLVVLHVDDEDLPGTHLVTPVEVRWTVRRDGVFVVEGEHPEPISAPVSQLFLGDVAAAAKQRTSDTVDGRYDVEITGVDHAGNPAVSTSFSWMVARDGPSIARPRKPVPSPTWLPSAVRRWDVEVAVTDPNGVAKVTYAIYDLDEEFDPIEGDLSLGQSGFWESSIVFPTSWSKHSVDLRISAEDNTGLPEEGGANIFGLDEIPEDFPRCVSIVFEGRPEVDITPMCYVVGNRAREYVFGGRNDESETLLFDDRFDGNYPYKRRNNEKSWKLAYPKDAVKSFFLDQHEVSVRQFFQFLDSDDGFGNSQNWPLDPPDSNRAAELRKSLGEAQSVDHPVTNVTWDEASAYAKWVGKEVLSFIEWEWAVRGKDYRAYPSDRGIAGIPPVADVNYGRKSGPWSILSGKDVTADTLIRNLGSNVAEWTRTPFKFVHGEEQAPRETNWDHARRFQEDFLDPGSQWNDCAEYWVAGPSFEDDGFDFSVSRMRGRDAPNQFGFRCSVPAASILEAMRPGHGGRFVAREIDPETGK